MPADIPVRIDWEPDLFFPPTLRALTPSSAKLCLGIGRLLQKYFPNGASMLIAISGGSDSTALALILAILAPRYGLRLHAMHIDHGLRAESHDDANFCGQFCQSLGIPCKVKTVDVGDIAKKRKCGIEEAGRQIRYEFLHEFRRQTGAHCIVLGHQRQDHCEDVLMRLIRGCGWPALAGMKERDAFIFRPLLGIEPQRLREFLRSCSCAWREDASNSSLDFRRNRLRHLVMPHILRENPSFGRNIANLRAFADADAEYWEELLNKALASIPWSYEAAGNASRLVLPKALLASLPRAARLRLYLRALKFFCHLTDARSCSQPRAETIFKIDDNFLHGGSGRHFELPGNVMASATRDGVALHLSNSRK